MKREAITHTKMKRLCRRLDIPLWQGVGLLESIWHLTARETPRGDLGKLSDEDIAIGIDYRGDDEARMIEALVYCGWLDRSPAFRLVVHDWNDHVDDSTHMKLARQGLYFVRADGTLVQPNLSRLPTKEKEAAERKYQNVRTDRQFREHAVDTPCAQNANPAESHDPATTLPRPATAATPRLDPALTPPLPRPATATSRTPLAESAIAIRENYPGTDDTFVVMLEDAVRQKLSSLNGGLKGEATDTLIAEAVRHCAKISVKQNGAGLFLKTVPQCVATWLTQGKAPAKPTRPLSVTQEAIAAAKERKAKTT